MIGMLIKTCFNLCVVAIVSAIPCTCLFLGASRNNLHWAVRAVLIVAGLAFAVVAMSGLLFALGAMGERAKDH